MSIVTSSQDYGESIKFIYQVYNCNWVWILLLHKAVTQVSKTYLSSHKRVLVRDAGPI